MSSYFESKKSSELEELKMELNSLKQDEQKEAVKQVIAMMTIGKDVSMLFPHVIK
jgi:AP-1 complex subunit beta-1